jgi:hypothetical protein
MAGPRNARFVPTLESLDERLNPSAPTSPLESAPVTPEGPQTLVFFLGGVPSPNAGDVVVAPPAAPAPVEISALVADPSGEATASDGRRYKMLAAPLIIELDGRQLRVRTLPVVERTDLLDAVSSPGGLVVVWASEGDGQPAGWLVVVKQQARADDGTSSPLYRMTFFPAEPAASDGTIAIKGSKITLKGTGEDGQSTVWIRVTGWSPSGDGSAARRRNLVVIHSMDL